jgi:hypothetical protein
MKKVFVANPDFVELKKNIYTYSKAGTPEIPY